MFGTVINCIDGRVQIPVLKYLEENFGPQFFDSCTEAGPLKILTERKESCRVHSLKKQLGVSIEKHGSKLIAVVGHHDCAGNPLPREAQEKQISETLAYLQKAYGGEMLYLGLYVNEKWEVEEVDRIEMIDK